MAVLKTKIREELILGRNMGCRAVWYTRDTMCKIEETFVNTGCHVVWYVHIVFM